MYLLHDAIVEILKPLADAGFAGFDVDKVEKCVEIYFLIVVFHCCNIPQ